MYLIKLKLVIIRSSITFVILPVSGFGLVEVPLATGVCCGVAFGVTNLSEIIFKKSYPKKSTFSKNTPHEFSKSSKRVSKIMN